MTTNGIKRLILSLVLLVVAHAQARTVLQPGTNVFLAEVQADNLIATNGQVYRPSFGPMCAALYTGYEAWPPPLYLARLGYMSRGTQMDLSSGWFPVTIVTNQAWTGTNAAAGFIMPSGHGVGPFTTNWFTALAGFTVTNWTSDARYYVGIAHTFDVNATGIERDGNICGLLFRANMSSGTLELVIRNTPTVPFTNLWSMPLSELVWRPCTAVFYSPAGVGDVRVWLYTNNVCVMQTNVAGLRVDRPLGMVVTFHSANTNVFYIGPMYLYWRPSQFDAWP